MRQGPRLDATSPDRPPSDQRNSRQRRIRRDYFGWLASTPAERAKRYGGGGWDGVLTNAAEADLAARCRRKMLATQSRTEAKNG